MPVSIVVGGQYGSEGKGKVSLHFAKELSAVAAVKVSGTNSGHTVYDLQGNKQILRVLPALCVLPGMFCIIAAGAYFQVEKLFEECARIKFPMDHLLINPNAGIITPEIEAEEKGTRLKECIGSTTSGTGLATYHRVACDGKFVRACEVPALQPYITDTVKVMRKWFAEGKHVIIEGGQGFGLSYLHTKEWPYCTSRDTTAAAFLGDAGLSPFDVANIIQVLRSYEIRVAGNSGPMAHETTWEQVTIDAKSLTPVKEWTSVSNNVRRVGYFDYDLVKEATGVNKPNIVVMNFMDYISEEDCEYGNWKMGPNRYKFIEKVEQRTGCRVTHVGFDGRDVRCIKEAALH